MILITERNFFDKEKRRYDALLRPAPRYEVHFTVVGVPAAPSSWGGKYREQKTNGLLVIYQSSAEIGLNNRTPISSEDLERLAAEVRDRQRALRNA